MEKFQKESELAKLEQQIERLALQVRNMVTSEFAEVLKFLKNPWKLVWNNFLIGLARGLGMAVGFAVLGAVVISLIFVTLSKMISLPLIGNAIGKFLVVVQEEKQRILQQGK